MGLDSETPKTACSVCGFAGAALRLLASLKLAVVLIVSLAAVLAWATFMESARGREYTQWYVYNSGWFIGLLSFLAVNIAAATLLRFSWRWSRVGFLLAHVGLLLLLVGSIQTFVAGIEGQLSLREGASGDTIILTHRSQFKVLARRPENVKSTDFSFCPGPSDWGADEQVDFGQVDGVGIKVLKFYRHGRRQMDWVADQAGLGAPAIEVVVTDSEGQSSEGQWHVANPFSPRPVAGKLRISLLQTTAQKMRDDFLEPPAVDAGSRGTLTVYYQDEVYPIQVDANMGKKVPMGDSGLAVEIVEYYANATMGGHGGGFTSAGDEPKNPMLQLKVHLADREKPISEIAFANSPFLNFESMRKQECPAKFWYHHPAAEVLPSAEFLQTPDGKLYCRVGVDGVFQPRGEAKAGDRIKVSGRAEVSLVSYIPHARQEATFFPIELAPGEKAGPEAAALVEFTLADKKEQFWLQRNSSQQGVRRIESPDGPLLVMFGYERQPLGLSVKLVDFQRGMNPGRMGDASFASDVELTDETQGLTLKRKISMNNPLEYGKFSFYQSSYQQLAGGVDMSVLSVAYDPGRFLKYLGSVMICVGIFFMFYGRVRFRRLIPSFVARDRTADETGQQKNADQQKLSDVNPTAAVDRQDDTNRSDVD